MEGLFLFAGLMLGELYQFGEKPVVFLGFVQKVGEGVDKEGGSPAEEGAEDEAEKAGQEGGLVTAVGRKDQAGADDGKDDANPAENFCEGFDGSTYIAEHPLFVFGGFFLEVVGLIGKLNGFGLLFLFSFFF